MSDIDADLVLRTMAGERPAFEALVSRHLRRARAVAGAVLDGNEAIDDVVQEAFLLAYDHLGQLTDPAGFPAWLTTIVRNQALAWRRKRRRERSIPLASIAEPGLRSTDDPGTAAEPDLDRLRRAMEQLTPEQRTLLALRYEAGLNLADIGETLGISGENAGKRLQRTQAQLARMLQHGQPDARGSR